MAYDERARATAAHDRPPGLTVYGCEQDEAALFHRLAAGVGVSATTTTAPVTEATVISVPDHRCASVSHTSELSRRELRALRDAGVDYVSTRSIGLDHIDLDAAIDLGITVENVIYAPDGVADFTVMLILMAIRDATDVIGARRPLEVTPERTRGGDLRDMTVGVVGVGRIGRAVIARLQGFGCPVLACGTDRTGSTPSSLPAEPVSFDELVRRSDVVTLHLPLTAATHHVMGRRQIEAMKPGAVLVNTARGALVDTEALIAALAGGRLGGAALDVLEGEERHIASRRPAPPVDDLLRRRLRRLPNVVVTPHVAYRTRRALQETVETTLTQCLTHERNRIHAQAHDRHPVRRLLGRA